MQQEHDADERDDDTFLRERPLHVSIALWMRFRAVIDRYDLDAFGSADAISASRAFTLSMTSSAFWHETAAAQCRWRPHPPVEFGNASALIRPISIRANPFNKDRGALVDLQHDVREYRKGF